MMPEDTALWNRFLHDHPKINATVAYDVHVGTPSPTPKDFPPPYKYMVDRLSTKRIDVVLFFPTETLVTEIKPYAGTTAIGQVLSYVPLFHRDFPHEPKPRPCIITDTPQPDIHYLCGLHNIILIELDRDKKPE